MTPPPKHFLIARRSQKTKILIKMLSLSQGLTKVIEMSRPHGAASRDSSSSTTQRHCPFPLGTQSLKVSL